MVKFKGTVLDFLPLEGRKALVRCQIDFWLTKLQPSCDLHPASGQMIRAPIDLHRDQFIPMF